MLPRAWYFVPMAASSLLAVAAAEASELWAAPLWAALGTVAIALPLVESKWTGAVALLLACGRAAIVNLDAEPLPAFLVVIATYAGCLLWRDAFLAIRAALSILGTLVLTGLLYEQVQGRLLTVAWGAQGGALLAAGFTFRDRVLRLSGLALLLLCIGKLFVYDLRELDTVSRIATTIVLGVVLMAASWVYTRFRDKRRDPG
jgi:uncharacterized membrane protein